MSFFSKSKSNVTIPDRKLTQFYNEHPQIGNLDRLIQIFKESAKLAVESRNPETAYNRYEQAIEIYYQIISLPIDRGLRKEIISSTEQLVSLFPSQVCMNEALGLSDKASKVKTIETQYKYLKEAEQVLEKGLEKKDDVGYENIMSIYVQIKDYVKQAEDQIENT